MPPAGDEWLLLVSWGGDGDFWQCCGSQDVSHTTSRVLVVSWQMGRGRCHGKKHDCNTDISSALPRAILLFFQYFYTFLAAANNYLRTSVSVSHGFRCICVQLAARVSADKKAGKVKEAKARLKCSLWRKHFAKHFARHWHWLHHPAVVIYKIWAYIYVHVYFGKLSVVQDSGGKRTRSGRERKVYDGNAADSWIINLARLFDFSRFHIASLSIWLGSVLVSWLTQTQHKRRTTTADIDTFRVARRRRKNRLRFIYIKAKISNNPHAKLKENALRNT